MIEQIEPLSYYEKIKVDYNIVMAIIRELKLEALHNDRTNENNQ